MLCKGPIEILAFVVSIIVMLTMRVISAYDGRGFAQEETNRMVLG